MTTWCSFLPAPARFAGETIRLVCGQMACLWTPTPHVKRRTIITYITVGERIRESAALVVRWEPQARHALPEPGTEGPGQVPDVRPRERGGRARDGPRRRTEESWPFWVSATERVACASAIAMTGRI